MDERRRHHAATGQIERLRRVIEDGLHRGVDTPVLPLGGLEVFALRHPEDGAPAGEGARHADRHAGQPHLEFSPNDPFRAAMEVGMRDLAVMRATEGTEGCGPLRSKSEAIVMLS